jgi:hypothetical protein
MWMTDMASYFEKCSAVCYFMVSHEFTVRHLSNLFSLSRMTAQPEKKMKEGSNSRDFFKKRRTGRFGMI